MKRIKRKGKRGFTLVELLVAISILAILTILAIPTLRALQSRQSTSQYENYKKSLITSGKLYNDSYSDDIFGEAPYGCSKIVLTELMNKKVAKDIALKNITCNNPTRDSFAIIKKFNNEYAYESYISCENDSGVIQYSDIDELAEQCLLDDGKPYISVTTDTPDTTDMRDTSKKKSVKIHLHDNYGFTANQKIAYAWSTKSSASGVNNYEDYNFNNKAIKTTGKEVVLSSKSITMKSNETNVYYLYVKPVKVQNIINNSITKVERYGPFRFDHEPPACPSISAVDENDKSLAEKTPARGIKLNLKFSADDFQNYDYQISYDDGATWSNTVTKDKSKLQILPQKDGKVKIRVKGRDNANNINSSWCNSKTYYNDNTAPDNMKVIGYKKKNATDVKSSSGLTTHNSNTLLSGWIFVQASGATDQFGAITYYYVTSGSVGTNATYKSGSYYNINTEGTSTITFKACDSAGNCSKPVSYISILDRTPPKCPSVSAKANNKTLATGTWTDAATVNFTFGFSNDTVKWDWYTDSSTNNKKVGGVTYKYWSTNKPTTTTASISGQGQRSIMTVVYDAAGNPNDCVSRTYNIDRCEATTIKWNAYGSCSKKCGTGTKSRTGTKYSTVSGHTSYKCGKDNAEKSSANCNTQTCCSSVTYKDGSSCSKKCGGGTKNRLAYSAYDGSRCSSKDKSSGGSKCNTQSCYGKNNCKLRGNKKHNTIGWYCTAGHYHTTAYYHYCSNSSGTSYSLATDWKYVCPTAPYGPAQGWTIVSG